MSKRVLIRKPAVCARVVGAAASGLTAGKRAVILWAGVLQAKVEKNTKQVQQRKAKAAKQSTEDDEGAAEADKPKRWSDYSVRAVHCNACCL